MSRRSRPPDSPDALEQVIEADRKFFERHRGRSYRIRLMGVAEREQAGRAGSTLDPAHPGFAWFAAVRQIAPGVRVKAFFQAPALCETDVPEDFARMLYQRAAGRNANALTNRLVGALKRAGAL